MTIPCETTVRSTLTAHDRGDRMREAILLAWQTSLAEAKPWWRRPATHASVMWENAVDHAVTALAAFEGVTVLNHYGTVSIIFDDKVLFRLKKAGMSLLTRNYPTQLARLFHQPSSDLFGYTDLQRVELVYVPNRFSTELIWLGVVARHGKNVLWKIELLGSEPVAIPLPLPARPSPADEVLLPAKRDDGAEERAAE